MSPPCCFQVVRPFFVRLSHVPYFGRRVNLKSNEGIEAKLSLKHPDNPLVKRQNL